MGKKRSIEEEEETGNLECMYCGANYDFYHNDSCPKSPSKNHAEEEMLKFTDKKAWILCSRCGFYELWESGSGSLGDYDLSSTPHICHCNELSSFCNADRVQEGEKPYWWCEYYGKDSAVHKISTFLCKILLIIIAGALLGILVLGAITARAGEGFFSYVAFNAIFGVIIVGGIMVFILPTFFTGWW